MINFIYYRSALISKPNFYHFHDMKNVSNGAKERGKSNYIFQWFIVMWLSNIITLVWHKKARFDSKMHGSTQKCPVWHKYTRFDTKMPSPACTSWHYHYQISPLLWEIQFHSNILFLRTNREMKMKLYWYEFKISIQYHYENWNVIIIFCLWWPWFAHDFRFRFTLRREHWETRTLIPANDTTTVH